MEPLLSVSGVSSGYGDIRVLDKVSIEVAEREVVSVIGANGAGKSTLLLTISGHLKAQTGHIRFGNTELSGISAHEAVGHVVIGQHVRSQQCGEVGVRPVEVRLGVRRRRPLPRRGGDVRVPVVAGEDLVGALAGLHDLHVLRHLLAQQVEGDAVVAHHRLAQVFGARQLADLVRIHHQLHRLRRSPVQAYKAANRAR